jgi:hypothetical protein
MSPGLVYLIIKRNWRAWLKMVYLKLFEPIYLNKVKNGPKQLGILVSFTTIPSRVKSAEYTVRSIISGKILPEAICVYVDDETFKLITTQSIFINKLITIGFLRLTSVKDVGPYTKFVYALKDYPETDIVICDDDVLYPDYWLNELLHTRYNLSKQNTIICHRGHEVTFKENGKINSYSEWPKQVMDIDSEALLFPTGTGGVLYPANSMPSIAYNEAIFKKLAPTADDIWFWLSAISNKCTFQLTRKPFNEKKFLEVPHSQTSNLWSLNVHKNANDTQLENSLNYFKENNKEMFMLFNRLN